MLTFLMWKEIPVAQLDIEIMIHGPVVFKQIILDAAHCPAVDLEKWLAERAIPSDREGLEEGLLRIFGLTSCPWGHMYGLQHTVAFLCHYMSMDDDYWLTPRWTETVCHAFQEPYMKRMYFWQKTTYEQLLYLKKHPDSKAGRIFLGEETGDVWTFSSLDFTIQSISPCRWTEKDGVSFLKH